MSVTTLDGGMGQELVARLGAPPTPLRATEVMMKRPELVRASMTTISPPGRSSPP